MRQHVHIARSLTGRIAAAVVALVTVTGCEARVAPPPAGAGYPPYLINTPVCAVDDFDDGGDCAAFGWAESRVHRPIP
jgi:hypothetical protein